MNILGRHIESGSSIIVDGRRVEGELSCTIAGQLLNCASRRITIQLSEVLSGGGMHLLQVQNPGGLHSNEFLFFVLD